MLPKCWPIINRCVCEMLMVARTHKEVREIYGARERGCTINFKLFADECKSLRCLSLVHDLGGFGCKMSRSLGIAVNLLHEASGHVVTVELKSLLRKHD
ncbi:hypothetical protein JHK84_031408 [Glycine max]|nr:hypothetical protein JHK84_031408 [Glycine max]